LRTAEERRKAYKSEELFAKSLYGYKFDDLGEIIDYQMPIYDKKYGAIDLLAYNDDGVLSLIELKREYNTETMLRAILEICTYFLQIDIEKLKNEPTSSFRHSQRTAQKTC
jgi:hypothetical protein